MEETITIPIEFLENWRSYAWKDGMYVGDVQEFFDAVIKKHRRKPMIDMDDLENRFNYHKPDEEKALKHHTARNECHKLALVIVALTPDGREQSLAVTKIEEAMFWANAALARLK